MDDLRFECTRCGSCCKRPGAVFLREQEVDRIASHLGATREALRAHHVRPDEDHGWIIDVPDGEACPFLRDDLCIIHEAKPDQCRAYPFWWEILSSKRRWEQEAQRCEGIGKGERIPLEQVRSLALLDLGVPQRSG
jgi:Fe-S-cluster containining protein